MYVQNGKIFASIDEFEGEIFALSALSRGLLWQVENVLPALATALLLGIPLESHSKSSGKFYGFGASTRMGMQSRWS